MSLVINDVSHSGTVASQFIVPAITGADTVQGGHVYVKDNIKKKFTIPRYELGNIIQDRVPTPTSSVGTQTVDGKVLDPQDYMIYFEFNPRDFEDHWYSEQLRQELIDRRLPVTVENVVLQETLKTHIAYFDRAIWQGSISGGTAPYNKFDGIITKAIADATVLDVGTPTTLTNSNINTEFQKGHALIPNSLKFDPMLKYFVSYKTADLWREFQQNQANKGVDVTSAGIMQINGKRIVPIAGFPDDKYIIAKGSADMSSNLWVGINSNSDETNIRMDFVAKNSELMFVKVLMKADTQIGFGKELVLYSA